MGGQDGAEQIHGQRPIADQREGAGDTGTLNFVQVVHKMAIPGASSMPALIMLTLSVGQRSSPGSAG